MGKDGIKLSLFAGYIVLYKGNPNKDSTKKLLELINKFIKVAGYQTDTQKLFVSLYTNSKLKNKQRKSHLQWNKRENNT